MDPASTLSKSFDLQIGKYNIAPTYWQAGAIIFLLFLLVLTLASVRRHFLEWSVKGAGFGVVLGFVLALIVEGFLLLGGRTALSEVFAWKSAPKPIAALIENGRNRLINVLGSSTEVPQSDAADLSSGEQVINNFQTLSTTEAQKVKEYICNPR